MVNIANTNRYHCNDLHPSKLYSSYVAIWELIRNSDHRRANVNHPPQQSDSSIQRKHHGPVSHYIYWQEHA